jgi:hypothetical protein
VQAQGYALMTARQELGNRALRFRDSTESRLFRTEATRSLALEGMRTPDLDYDDLTRLDARNLIDALTSSLEPHDGESETA